MPLDLPRGKGLYSPFSGHSHLLHLHWPLITNVIETTVILVGVGYCFANVSMQVMANCFLLPAQEKPAT